MLKEVHGETKSKKKILKERIPKDTLKRKD